MKTTKNEVVIWVMNNALIQSAIKNICPREYLDDFRSHFYLQLLELKGDKLIKAYHAGWIEWLCVRILSNQMNSTTSTFWKIYKNNGFYKSNLVINESDLIRDSNTADNDDLTEWNYQEIWKDPTDESDLHIENLIELEIKREKIIDLLNGRHYYHRHLYLMQLEGMTYRAIEKETGISYQSVRLSILSTTKWLKERIKI